MGEMIERVARAHYSRTVEIVAITRPGAPFMPWDELPEEQRRICLAGARAAIEAMRVEEVVYWVDGRPNASPQDIHWNQRIDAALKE